jgi:hypothetical protein
MYPANDENCWLSASWPFGNVQSMANACFTRLLRQFDALAHAGIGRLDVDESRLNLRCVHDEGHRFFNFQDSDQLADTWGTIAPSLEAVAFADEPLRALTFLFSIRKNRNPSARFT